MSDNLTQEEVSQFKDVFAMVDKDGDGSVTAAELRGLMRKVKEGQDVSPEAFEDMVNEFDEDRGGTLDFPQFLDLMGTMAGMGNDRAAENDAIFDIMAGFAGPDAAAATDGNGGPVITADDLRKLMAAMGESVSPEEVEGLLAQAMSVDHAAGISRDDFLAFLAADS